MTRTRALALAVCAAACPLTARGPTAAEGAHPLDRLGPRHWCEVPDSHLRKVAFKWPKGVKYTVNNVGLEGIMTCWSGGAYDTRRDRLIVWGGGHYAYAGNEVYAFDVKRLKWERLSDPSLKTDPEGKHERDGVYPDGLPRSCHTYDYLEYLPGIDRFCSFGVGATFPLKIGVDPKKLPTWAFNFDTGKWEKKSNVPWRVHSSALDPVTGRIWVRSRFAPYVAEWDPPKDVWAVRSKRIPGGSCWAVSVIDPIGRRFLTMGRDAFWGCDISAKGMIAQEDVKSTGPQDIIKAKVGPAADYDPVLDKLVCWNGGAGVCTLDFETYKWEKVAPAASNRVAPTPPCKNGTWGRWRYVPSKNAYVLVNDVDQNVYFYRLTRRAGQPIPRRFVEALKKRDAALVKWVAGQVALWPKARSEPVLKAALSAQSGVGAEAIKKALKEVE